jgi:hypothetical protein
MTNGTHITYADIQAYLEAIADNPNNTRNVDNSSHRRFWNVPYQQFVTGNVPNERCNGNPIPIVNRDPNLCPFYQSLKNSSGWCNLSQMPRRGPYITDPGYKVTLRSGRVITGAEIDANIVWWLTNGMPEH